MVDDQPAKLLSYESCWRTGREPDQALSRRKSRSSAEERRCGVLMDVSMPSSMFSIGCNDPPTPAFRGLQSFLYGGASDDLDQSKDMNTARRLLSVPVVRSFCVRKSGYLRVAPQNAQLETLNRELEQRVLERTEELARKRNYCCSSIWSWWERIKNLMHYPYAPDIIFSRKNDGARITSATDFMILPALPGLSEWFRWLDYVHSEDKQRPWRTGCSASNQEQLRGEYRIRQGWGYRWFERGGSDPRSGWEDRECTGRVPTFTTANCGAIDSRQRTELEKMVDRRTDELRRLSVRLMTMQDRSVGGLPRSARRVRAGTRRGKMVLDKMIWRNRSTVEMRGCRPATSLIAPFSRCAPCLTFCIRRYLMKLAYYRRLHGTWKAYKAQRN